MDDTKPGWTTSEFWTTWGGKVMALVVALVGITGGNADQQNTLGGASEKAVIGLGAIFVFGWLATSYAKGRVALKNAKVTADVRTTALTNAIGTVISNDAKVAAVSTKGVGGLLLPDTDEHLPLVTDGKRFGGG